MQTFEAGSAFGQTARSSGLALPRRGLIWFVTNDNRLAGLAVSGVTLVTGIERAPY